MADEDLTGNITIEIEENNEEIFTPQSKIEINAVLEPEPVFRFDALPKFSIPKKTLIIDIETTGIDPTESRIITIGFLDPSPEEIEPKFILQPTERETVQTFIDFYENEGFTEIVGYNVDFDYRWIFVACQKYRIQAPNFMKAEIYDMLHIQKTGSKDFVPSLNKFNSLDDWSQYLLGLEKITSAEEVLKAWEDGNLQLIIDHVLNDVVLVYAIWVLDQFVRGIIQIALPPVDERTTTFEQNSPARVVESIPLTDKEFRQCNKCLSGQFVLKGSTKNKCILESCDGLL